VNATLSALNPLTLRFAHNVIEHLGLKLYQNKPTNVLAELVSNSWDAMASRVFIELNNSPSGSPASISVFDDGRGMSKTDLATNYLVVGQPKPRPSQSPDKSRYPMGRKGIGKLAPFGIARIVHVVTVQNDLTMWLVFDYDAMLAAEHADASTTSIYAPTILADEVALDQLSSIVPPEMKDVFAKFQSTISSTASGTLVHATNLTLRKPISTVQLRESLGRRFTVTLARPDFTVHVNGGFLSESDVFPEWELRIPAVGTLEEAIHTPTGQRMVRYWVGFVKEASWSQEQAGVGVYAHGKVAQDRPFFFGVKGREIFSRYMYAVVEADWIDELPQDTISTDRTSVHWEDPDLEPLYNWGAKSVVSWIGSYEQKRKDVARLEDTALVDGFLSKTSDIKLRDTDKSHLIELISTVTPRLGKDHSARVRLVEATAKAWVHEPARKLIRELWEKVTTFEPTAFAASINRLSDELVPESLSLAVAFSLRVFALTQLHGHILKGQETQLQTLIESFPWILNTKYERYVYRRALATIVEQEANLIATRNPFPPIPADRTKPDFVFFGSPEDREILIVELKGPADTAQQEEYQQLHSYVLYLASRFTSSRVSGLLVSGDHSSTLMSFRSESMDFMKWNDVLLQSRRGHMDLLTALLVGTDPAGDDTRIQQVCELGGTAVRDFLTQMSVKEPQLRDLVNRLTPVPGTPQPKN